MVSLAASRSGGRSGRLRLNAGLRALAMVLFVLLLAACGDSFDEDIAAVKAAPAPGGNNEQFLNQLAGARGQVTWKGAKPQQYKDNPNIVEVVGHIDKTTRAGAKRQVDLVWINNRQTKQIALERVAIDGQPQSMAVGALGILLMQLE